MSELFTPLRIFETIKWNIISLQNSPTDLPWLLKIILLILCSGTDFFDLCFHSNMNWVGICQTLRIKDKSFFSFLCLQVLFLWKIYYEPVSFDKYSQDTKDAQRVVSKRVITISFLNFYLTSKLDSSIVHWYKTISI